MYPSSYIIASTVFIHVSSSIFSLTFNTCSLSPLKIAVDETGKLLTYGVIYPTPPQSDYEGSKKKVIEIINKFNINAISIGNGTASRETEEFVAKVLSEIQLNVEYTIVNEAGASVYSV